MRVVKIDQNAWGLRRGRVVVETLSMGMEKNPKFVWGPSPRIPTQYFCVGMRGAIREAGTRGSVRQSCFFKDSVFQTCKKIFEILENIQKNFWRVWFFPLEISVQISTFNIPLSQWPTQTRPTHCPTHPHTKILRGDAWGCVGMVPTQNLYFFPSPWKKSQRLLDVSVRPHGKFDLGIHPHAKFEVEFRLTPTSVPVPTQNLALVSVPTQTSDVGTRPHAKFRPPVGQWDRGVSLSG